MTSPVSQGCTQPFCRGLEQLEESYLGIVALDTLLLKISKISTTILSFFILLLLILSLTNTSIGGAVLTQDVMPFNKE